MGDTFDKLLLELERCLMGTSRRQFTDEFKRESVGLLASSGRSPLDGHGQGCDGYWYLGKEYLGGR